MNVNPISIKDSRPALVFLLAALAALTVAFAWGGAGRMMRMQTQAATNAECAQLKVDDQTKIVIEVAEASGGRIRGRLLEKKDETH